MKKRALLALIGTGMMVGAAFVSYRWMNEWRWQERTDDAYLHSDMTPISPQVGGYIAAVEVGDNQLVRKGTVLVRIDDRDYRARAEEAQAAVAAREAALDNLEARTALQKASIIAAEAQIAGASAEKRLSQADLRRAEAMLQGGAVSRQRLDTSEADATKADAGLRAAEANADAARRQLAVLESERRMAQAQLDQARAQLAEARLDLEHTVVTAPVDGMVGDRSAQMGEFVRPGSPLMVVVPVDDVWVEANFKETQVDRMQTGQAVSITVDSFPGQTLSGHVDSLAPASGAKFSLLPPDNATGNFTKVVQRIPVKIVINAGNPLAGRLRPGMSAVVAVETRPDHEDRSTVAGPRVARAP